MIYKTVIRTDIGTQLETKKERDNFFRPIEKSGEGKTIDLFHNPDNQTCIYNYKINPNKVKFEMLNPILCEDCKSGILKQFEKTDNIGLIRNKLKGLEKLLFRLKFQSAKSYIINILLKKPVSSFIFSLGLGLLTGVVYEPLFSEYINRFFNNDYVEFAFLSLFLLAFILIVLLLIYYIRGIKIRKLDFHN